MTTPDVAVVGGGIIGLSIAWRCAQRGMTVQIFDPSAGGGASNAAAGMLASVAESTFGEEPLSRLLVESARRWPGFAAELAAATGHDLGYRSDGTLTVALTSDDLAEAARLWDHQSGLGLDVARLRPTALRDREPALSPRLRGGAFAPDDHQVDPRRVVAALTAALDGSIVRRQVARLDEVAAGVMVVAAGCGTAELTGLPIRPVKGQILRLRPNPATRRAAGATGAVGLTGVARAGGVARAAGVARVVRTVGAGDPVGGLPEAVLTHVVRGYVDGRQVYLVPRTDGEVVVGATAEERTDAAVTAGGVLDLLRAAIDLVPELAEYELVETLVRHRPAAPDNAPLLGRWGRHVVAAGHHRHGVLLAPVTADLIADLIGADDIDPLLKEFAPTRFEGPCA